MYFINKKILEKSASQNKRTPHECQNFVTRKFRIQQKVSISENNVGFIEQNYRNFINIYLQFNTDCALKITEASHHLAGQPGQDVNFGLQYTGLFSALFSGDQ